MKDFDPNKPSEGLGDAVAKLTDLLGIAKLVDEVTKAVGVEDCGCNRRREKLNELFPFNKEAKTDQDATEGE